MRCGGVSQRRGCPPYKLNNMDTTPKEIRIYETADGKRPFIEWLKYLKDINAKAKILRRIERIKIGNLGDCKSVGKGVCELRIDCGAGNRIYFGQVGNAIVIILCGGEKNTQDKDIIAAQEYWEDYSR